MLNIYNISLNLNIQEIIITKYNYIKILIYYVAKPYS